MAHRLPYVALGVLPTPVERLLHLGHDQLWIKREDLSSPRHGGNKVRKLEFTLADAMRRGHRTVVTMGGLGTNHGLATAIFCRQLGLRACLALYDQPITPHVLQTLLRLQGAGAALHRYRTLLGAGVALQTVERLRNPGAYILASGGSSPMGTIGVVNAMFELREQVDAGLMPAPDVIFTALGSSGTMAGLSLGALLAGLTTRVIGVRVTMDHAGPVPIANRGTVRALMRRTLALLRRYAPEVPAVEIPAQLVIDAQVGAGYGHGTAAGAAAAEIMMQRERLALDPTYTAKTFAAVRDYIGNAAHRRDVVLYWHTFFDMVNVVPPIDMGYRTLPRAFHAIFEQAIEPADG